MTGRWLLAAVVALSLALVSCKEDEGLPVSPDGGSQEIPLPPRFDPLVAEIAGNVNADSLVWFVQELSGYRPVLHAGGADTIFSRAAGTRGHTAVQGYLVRKLSSYGLTVTRQAYSTRGTNIYAVQPGVGSSSKTYIICAHYDDRPGIGLAPGADDNASGTAAVIEAARILSRYKLSCSIMYAFWDEEEDGLIGSSRFADEVVRNDQSIAGVLNLDMLGWDGNNDGMVEVHTRYTPGSIALARAFVVADSLYAIGLVCSMYAPGITASDHASFWSAGIDAVVLIEAIRGGDFNPRYHTVHDSLSYFNTVYFRNCARLAVAALAGLAGVPPGGAVAALKPLAVVLP